MDSFPGKYPKYRNLEGLEVDLNFCCVTEGRFIWSDSEKPYRALSIPFLKSERERLFSIESLVCLGETTLFDIVRASECTIFAKFHGAIVVGFRHVVLHPLLSRWIRIDDLCARRMFFHEIRSR